MRRKKCEIFPSLPRSRRERKISSHGIGESAQLGFLRNKIFHCPWTIPDEFNENRSQKRNKNRFLSLSHNNFALNFLFVAILKSNS
jgi:hypothetical protein